MAKYAQIDAHGVVVNLVEWNGDTKLWQPPEGFTVVRTDAARIGDSYDGARFTTPVRPEPEPVKSEAEQLADLLRSKNLITAQERADLRAARGR